MFLISYKKKSKKNSANYQELCPNLGKFSIFLGKFEIENFFENEFN